MYMLSFLTLSPTAGFNDPEGEIPGLLLKSDVNLFNHLVRKAMLWVVVLRVLFFVDMSVAPYSVSLICIV